MAVCSSQRHGKVEALGADHVFDYKSDNVVEQIKNAAPPLRYIVDTISDEAGADTAIKARG